VNNDWIDDQIESWVLSQYWSNSIEFES